jgi:hypothetical protein
MNLDLTKPSIAKQKIAQGMIRGLPVCTFDFLLRFKLSRPYADPSAKLQAIAGCDGSTVRVAQDGSVTVQFSRTADSATTAVASTIADVVTSVPGCHLLSAELVR